MKILGHILAALGTIALAFTLFAAGYFACAAPVATQLLSQAASDYDRSPYTLDDLVALAVASRDLTVDARPAESTPDQARTAFNEQLMLAATHSSSRYLADDAAARASADPRKRDLWDGLLQSLGAESPSQAFTLDDVNTTASSMAAQGDAFALDDDAFAHLDDCNALIQAGTQAARIAALVALISLIALLAIRRRREAARMLTAAPLFVILFFCAMGAWAFLDFQSLFSALHGVFFPQGNWTFSTDSLLICMYPTAFWMGMGIIWLATTLLASIIVLALGRWVARRAR